MQPENGTIASSTPPPPADWPEIDLPAAGQNDGGAVESTLADVEQRLEAWLGALEVRTALLAETEAHLEERRRTVEAAERSLIECRQQLETDESASPSVEPSGGEPDSASDAGTDARPAQKERMLRRLGGEAGNETQRASQDEPVASAGGLELSDQRQPAEATDGAPPPGLERAAGTTSRGCALSVVSVEVDSAAEAGPATDESATDQTAAVEPAASPPAPGDPQAGQSAEDDPPVARQQSTTGAISSADLPPETAQKLRVLRRLAGPGKTDAELLAQLAAREASQEPQDEVKRRWWKRGR